MQGFFNCFVYAKRVPLAWVNKNYFVDDTLVAIEWKYICNFKCKKYVLAMFINEFIYWTNYSFEQIALTSEQGERKRRRTKMHMFVVWRVEWNYLKHLNCNSQNVWSVRECPIIDVLLLKSDLIYSFTIKNIDWKL